MQRASNNERNMQLLIRSITSGVISDRDHLLTYTIGEFYQEMSLFLTESEIKNKELQKR